MNADEAIRFMANAPRQPVRARLAALVQGRTVIDLGCGKAEEIGELYTPAQYLGVDCSIELIKYARNRWPLYLFSVAAIQELNGHWPIGIMLGVLEHVPFDEAVVMYERARMLVDVLYLGWHTEPHDQRKRIYFYQGELDTPLQQNRHPRQPFRGIREREEVGTSHVIWTVDGC